MILTESNASELKVHLTQQLEPICDADPSVLADYVIALLRHDKTIPELKQLCSTQLDDFLKIETDNFVNLLFDTLASKKYSSDDQIIVKEDSQRSRRSPSVEKSKRSRDRSPDSNRNSSDSKSRRYNDDQRSNRVSDSGSRDGRRSNFGEYPQTYQTAFRNFTRLPNFLPNQGRVSSSQGKKRCYDYDEKGFCLRGELCPYDHGTNHIMVDDIPGPMMMGGMPFMPNPIDPFGVRLKNVGIPEGYEPEFPTARRGRGGFSPRGTQNFRGRGGRGTTSSAWPASNKLVTLNIEKIPTEFCTMEKVNEYFKQFGTIVNIQIQPAEAKAIVSFSQHSEAKAAFSSPEVIFGNRFVKVYWNTVGAEENSVQHHPLATTAAANSIERQAPTWQTEQPPAAFNRQQKTFTTPVNAVVDEKKKNAQLIQKQMQLVIQKQMETQKLLLKQLESKTLAVTERAKLMEQFKGLMKSTEESQALFKASLNEVKQPIISSPSNPISPVNTNTESGQSNTESSQHADDESMVADSLEPNPELVARLESLKRDAVTLGIDPNNPTTAAPYFRGSRGRGGFRGGGGGFRGGFRGGWRGGRGGASTTRSFKLDNRPARVLVQGVQPNQETELIEHFKTVGDVNGFEYIDDNSGILTFKSRASAELGSTFQETKLNIYWPPVVTDVGEVAEENIEDEEMNE